MSIFSGSTEMLRKVKEAIEKSASEVKEKLLGIIEDAKNEQEEVNSNLKQAIDREAARNDVQDEKIEDHERKIHLTQQELNFFKEDQAEINKSLDSAIVAEKERNDQQDETLKQHSEAIEKNTADILENADKAHQDLEAHKEESAAKFEDLSQKVDTNTQNIKQTREELQEQLGEHDNRITENKNQILANAEKAARELESAVLDLKKSILETNKDVMQNATNINLISANVDKKIEGQNLRIEAIEDLLDELIKEVKEEFKVLHDNTTLNSEQISKLNQSVTEINSLIEKLDLNTKENTENINLIFEELENLKGLDLEENFTDTFNSNFSGKVRGSLTECPHQMRITTGTELLDASRLMSGSEVSQSIYNQSAVDNDEVSNLNLSAGGQSFVQSWIQIDVLEVFKRKYPKLINSFDLNSKESEIEILKKFVKKVTFICKSANYAEGEEITAAALGLDYTWITKKEHADILPTINQMEFEIPVLEDGDYSGNSFVILYGSGVNHRGEGQSRIALSFVDVNFEIEYGLFDVFAPKNIGEKTKAEFEDVIDLAVKKAKEEILADYSDLREYVDGKLADLSMEQISMNNRLSEFEGVTNQSIANVEMNANSRFREIETNLEGTKLESQATSEKVASIEGEQTIIKNEISTLKGQVNDLMNGGTN